jgi:hypothetical protein
LPIPFFSLPARSVVTTPNELTELPHRSNPKVTGLIPDGVTGIFIDKPSGRTMSLGSTQPLTEMSTNGTSWRGKGGRYLGLTTLLLSLADCLEILRA